MHPVARCGGVALATTFANGSRDGNGPLIDLFLPQPTIRLKKWYGMVWYGMASGENIVYAAPPSNYGFLETNMPKCGSPLSTRGCFVYSLSTVIAAGVRGMQGWRSQFPAYLESSQIHTELRPADGCCQCLTVGPGNDRQGPTISCRVQRNDCNCDGMVVVRRHTLK